MNTGQNKIYHLALAYPTLSQSCIPKAIHVSRPLNNESSTRSQHAQCCARISCVIWSPRVKPIIQNQLKSKRGVENLCANYYWN